MKEQPRRTVSPASASEIRRRPAAGTPVPLGFRANQPLLDLIKDFANRKGVTPAQISLAWILHKNDFIVPIPGSRKLKRIQENLGAADINLTEEEFSQIEAELAEIEIHGNRTDEDIAKLRHID